MTSVVSSGPVVDKLLAPVAVEAADPAAERRLHHDVFDETEGQGFVVGMTHRLVVVVVRDEVLPHLASVYPRQASRTINHLAGSRNPQIRQLPHFRQLLGHDLVDDFQVRKFLGPVSGRRRRHRCRRFERRFRRRPLEVEFGRQVPGERVAAGQRPVAGFAEKGRLVTDLLVALVEEAAANKFFHSNHSYSTKSWSQAQHQQHWVMKFHADGR